MVRKMPVIEKASRRRRGADAADGARRRARRNRDPGHGPRRTRPRMMEIAKINGQIQAKSIERVGDMVKRTPQETVAVLRDWIQERDLASDEHRSTRRNGRRPNAPRCSCSLLGEKLAGRSGRCWRRTRSRRSPTPWRSSARSSRRLVERLHRRLHLAALGGGAVTGSLDRTEELLAKIIPDRAGHLDHVGDQGRLRPAHLAAAVAYRGRGPRVTTCAASTRRRSPLSCRACARTRPRAFYRSCRTTSRSTSSTAC